MTEIENKWARVVIEGLKKEIEELNEELNMQWGILWDMDDEKAKMLKDALRYRWLKKVQAETLCCIAYRRREACAFSVEEVDECVDAAIEASRKQDLEIWAEGIKE